MSREIFSLCLCFANGGYYFIDAVVFVRLSISVLFLFCISDIILLFLSASSIK